MICTRYVHRGGGSILVLSAADPKGPPEACDSLTLARPCLRPLLYALSLVVRCPAARFVHNSRHILFFFQLVAQRRDVDPRAAFYFVSERQHPRIFFFVGRAYSPLHRLVDFLLKVLFPASRPFDIVCVFFYVLKRIHSLT